MKLFTICSSREAKPSVSIIAVMWFKENLKQNSSNSCKQRVNFMTVLYKNKSVLLHPAPMLGVTIITRVLRRIRKLYDKYDDTDLDNHSTWRKAQPSATLSATNPIQTSLGSSPGLCCERLAWNHLSQSMVCLISIERTREF
jgi:hypothetical protein